MTEPQGRFQAVARRLGMASVIAAIVFIGVLVALFVLVWVLTRGINISLG